MMAGKLRLDELIVKRRLACNIEEARKLCIAGRIKSSDVHIINPSQRVATDIDLRFSAQRRFVSRGGDKLQGALNDFSLNVKGMYCLDVGASTGGFTDCLLQNGASFVTAVDVGYGQFAQSLRKDSRVRLLERTNIRSVDAKELKAPFDLIVVDLSFARLSGLLDKLHSLLADDAKLLMLVKPQFELPDSEVDSGGVIKDESKRMLVIENLLKSLPSHGLRPIDNMASQIKGSSGNQEYFVLSALQQ